jgi:hypothetical protein
LTGKKIHQVEQGCGTARKKSDLRIAGKEGRKEEKAAEDERSFRVRFGVSFAKGISKG